MTGTEETRVGVGEGPSDLGDVGLVAIGRNEGERLQRCLESVPDRLGGVAYVDSGSDDGSVALAESFGARVVALDMDQPFTAARARNAGFRELLRNCPGISKVQFVDGDCSLVSGWLERASGALDRNPGWWAVCGFRRETDAGASVYNRICDIEWRVPPVGPVGDFGFGGDVMIRSDSFERVGGYADDLIAGEDPELSARLCAAGGEVVRLDEDMTRHDADMHRFGQWWTRNKRSGHAYAEVAARHPDTGLFAAHLRSGWVWGFAVPAVMVGGLALGAWPILMLLGLYPLRALRIARWLDPARFGNGDRLVWGLSCIASQFPGWLGAATFAFNRARGRRASLMEYKGPEDVEGGR